jgi:hypothetical protein
MKKLRQTIVTLLFVSNESFAMDYTVDFTRIEDFETLRPLVEQCKDFGALEHYRDRLESSRNLEEMRASLTDMGFGMFNKCPDGISGAGITADVVSKPPSTLSYTVDFTRVENFESIRPLVEGCDDFGALEQYRDRLESSQDLETMRTTLRNIGFGMFNDCPGDISGQGISRVKY